MQKLFPMEAGQMKARAEHRIGMFCARGWAVGWGGSAATLNDSGLNGHTRKGRSPEILGRRRRARAYTWGTPCGPPTAAESEHLGFELLPGVLFPALVPGWLRNRLVGPIPGSDTWVVRGSIAPNCLPTLKWTISTPDLGEM